MIESTTVVKWATLLAAAGFWLLALVFLFASLHADSTSPPGQINESAFGYTVAAMSLIFGGVFFGVYRIYHNDRLTNTKS